MKILVVHQNYLHPGQPGGSRFNEFARLWSEAGHQVTVISGTLNYATNETPAKYRRRWMTKEYDGPVEVWRCHLPASYGKSTIGRMWAFLGFTLSTATAAARVRNVDIVIATSPPLTTALSGYLAARLHVSAVPWIFEIRDLWPESAITTGVIGEESILTNWLFALEKWACRKATRVNVLSPAFEENVVRRGLVPAEKVFFVPNGADVSMFYPRNGDDSSRRDLGWGDRFVVMYCGAHGRANRLMQLIEAAELLRRRTDILIACVGDGPERPLLEAERAKRGLANIVFHGPKPKVEMPSIVNACDVGAAVLQDNPTFRTVYPNKVFDYMACEKPVLLAIDGEARKLVCEEARAGLFASPEDAEDIARRIVEMRHDGERRAEMGCSGRRWVLANATRQSLAERYLAHMESLVAKAPD